LILKHESMTEPEFSYSLDIPGRCYIPEIKAIITARLCEKPPGHFINKPGNQAFFEAESLPEVLTIRTRTPGDCYGGSGHRKVKKMLIDRKIPLAQRMFLPMVVEGANVIWIPGFRPARTYEVQPGPGLCVALDFAISPGPK
jgi:tRNA(Ile)-lysidine synthase